MATSGTYVYDPTVADFVDEAFERCGIDPAKLTQRHLRSSRTSINLLLAWWATKGCKLWAIEQETVNCVQSQPSYNLDAGTIAVLDMVVRRSGLDTPVMPMSRDYYLRIPDKDLEGLPTLYYFDRQRATQTITLWNVPENATDDLIFYRLRRLQDVTAAAETLDLPYEWFEAFASGLAEFLAVKFAPDRLTLLKGLAGEKFKDAYVDNRERVDTVFTMR